ncbi:MAG: hypothetical protein Q9N68_10680 [Gammaproteobacteria bacterium]|nr:hypothetical protein [Gammaproteobacteria bacterium]
MPSPTTPLDASALQQLEADFWQKGFDEQKLQRLIQQHQRHQATLTQSQCEQQHHFVIVIPIADRPHHLQSCLQSLLTLCQTYQYGGIQNGVHNKVCVLLADDSQQEKNIQKQKKITADFNQRGLKIDYFGQTEQLKLLSLLPPAQQKNISQIIGKINPDRFYHKGASITRNIAYLKLQRDYAQIKNVLFYFIDSDQEFQLNIQTNNGEQHHYAINYFYHLDRIFHNQKIQLLTGKVVGDPPVSPAVMANTLLTDLKPFLKQMAAEPATAACPFHTTQPSGDAHYHDMADLFDLPPQIEQAFLQCPLSKKHTRSDSFAHVAQRLNHFFDGAHPTRKSHFNYSPAEGLSPARTVYSGNYIFRPTALEFFLPFANLKLRMAGPTLGRLIQSKIGAGFVSANLPMLHQRTVQSEGRAEFRPGVQHQENLIDLSTEFERQFYGDVMLFSMIKFTQLGYPEKNLNRAKIEQVSTKVEAELRQKYQQKQQQTLSNLSQLSQHVNDPQQWWHQEEKLQPAYFEFQRFLKNMQHNFSLSAQGYQLITSAKHRQTRLAEIQHALLQLKTDQEAWQRCLTQFAQPTGEAS